MSDWKYNLNHYFLVYKISLARDFNKNSEILKLTTRWRQCLHCQKKISSLNNLLKVLYNLKSLLIHVLVKELGEKWDQPDKIKINK